MSTRVTINIGFFFQKEHYAQLLAYIPRTEAIAIPELRLEEKDKALEPLLEVSSVKPSKKVKSESKKGSDEDISEEDDNDNIIQNEMEIDNQIENEEDNLMDQEQQKEMENALQQLEDDEEEELDEDEENYDSDRLEQDQDEDMELDSMSNQSPIKNFSNHKTKRQKGQTKDLIQLPDRRPRKDKKLDEANQIVRREEKERKRKQYLKKQIEAQEKATLDKILNQTGRKLRLREQKQIQQVIDREQKVYRTLGNVPKIITVQNQEGTKILIHKTKLFPQSMTSTRDLKMKEVCNNCGSMSKYKLKDNQKFACSLPCYKILTV